MKITFFLYLSAMIAILTAAPCQAAQKTDTSDTDRQPGQQVHIYDELTLAAVTGHVLRGNQRLRSLAAAVKASEGAALQAGLLPNPEIGAEVENFAGQGAMSGFDSVETTVYLSQLLELGSKRAKRSQVARHNTSLALQDYERARLDVLTGASEAFIKVLAAQELADLDRALVRLAERTADVTGERVEAGKVSPVEKTRTLIELATARSEFMRAQSELQAARSLLASYWGREQVQFARVAGDIEAVKAPVAVETLMERLSENPDIARWEMTIDRDSAALELARAQAIPDITLNAGVRNFQDTGDNAFVMGITVPMPVFDRNQGGVAEAAARLESDRHSRLATRLEAEMMLSALVQRLGAAYAQALSLRDTIMPGARAAYQTTEEGYREGKFTLMQLLDAQRTLFNVNRQYIDALENYHILRIRVERITGSVQQDQEPENT